MEKLFFPSLPPVLPFFLPSFLPSSLFFYLLTTFQLPHPLFFRSIFIPFLFLASPSLSHLPLFFSFECLPVCTVFLPSPFHFSFSPLWASFRLLLPYLFLFLTITLGITNIQ